MNIVVGKIIKGKYFDSVTLMRFSQTISSKEGVLDSSIVMGTQENISILKAADLYLPLFDEASESDLIVAIKGPSAQEVLGSIEDLFKKKDSVSGEGQGPVLYSLESALEQNPESNLVLISTAGKYAGDCAMKALKKGLHVHLFSDNISIEEEKALKEYAVSQGLLMMGPDCGTAMINGVPLCFANKVKQGAVGLVAASGTGAQEVSTLISRYGGGLSHIIGTGGRDLKEAIGGLMFLEGIRLLSEDPETKVLVLISKPPHPSVRKKIEEAISKTSKPVVTLFLGDKTAPLQTLEDAAFAALKHLDIVPITPDIKKPSLKRKGRYVRALFSGGTFASETQTIFDKHFKSYSSNVPLDSDKVTELENPHESLGHTVIDLGDDQFTVGKPHPMIDFSTRVRRIEKEALDPETAIILLDIVLGYGSHLDPLGEVSEVISKYREQVLFIGSVTGTDEDPQVRRKVVDGLIKCGMIIADSNAKASELAVTLLGE